MHQGSHSLNVRVLAILYAIAGAALVYAYWGNWIPLVTAASVFALIGWTTWVLAGRMQMKRGIQELGHIERSPDDEWAARALLHWQETLQERRDKGRLSLRNQATLQARGGMMLLERCHRILGPALTDLDDRARTTLQEAVADCKIDKKDKERVHLVLRGPNMLPDHRARVEKLLRVWSH